MGTAVIAWRNRKQMRMVFLTTQGEHVRDRMEKGAVEVPIHCLRRAGCGYAHQAVVQDEVWVTSKTSLVWSLATGSDDG